MTLSWVFEHVVTKLDTSRLSSITLQNARFSARGKVWDESGRGFRGSGTNNQRQTPCRALVGSRGLTLSRGRGNAHPEALLIRTCPQSIACFQIWASKRQTCYLMELHSLYWRSNNTFLVSWRYGRKHEHWKHLQTRTIHLKDDKESWKDRLVIFFTCRRSVRKVNNCDPKLEECGLGRSFSVTVFHNTDLPSGKQHIYFHIFWTLKDLKGISINFWYRQPGEDHTKGF